MSTPSPCRALTSAPPTLRYARLEPMRPYLRDVADELKLLHEDICAQRDRVTSVLEASLALIAHRQNQSLRKYSRAGRAIFAVPTLIAGVFRMNFQNVPGSGWHGGFAVCLALMALAAFVLYVSLRRARWM